MTNDDSMTLAAVRTTAAAATPLPTKTGRRKQPVPEGPVVFPQDVVDRIARVAEYHRASKHTYKSVREPRPVVTPAIHISPYREFADQVLPVVKLPHDLLDAATPALALLHDGVGAVPDEFEHPPQTLRTLASWLYLADGVTAERKGAAGGASFGLRTCPSCGATFPFELYVAAFAIDGLDPGLYHYCPRGFTLRKLRGGADTFSQLRKGRPDLDFLKGVPAAILVSSVFSRSAWKFRERGYRYALDDAGHLVQNLITSAAGIGIGTHTRLRMNDKTTRELIGVVVNESFGDVEAIQAMVVWTDEAERPLELPSVVSGVVGGRKASLLLPIARVPLAPTMEPQPSILQVHADCVAPGVAVRDVRSPLTELSPLPEEQITAAAAAADELTPPPADFSHAIGPSLRTVLRSRRSSGDFVRTTPLALDHLWTINRLAFRGGTFAPIFPSGPHVGLVRPFWAIHDVAGMPGGIWHYDPIHDCWHSIKPGEFRIETQYVSLEQRLCGNASAACFIMSDLPTLMQKAGPDVYRLAHLEAGIVGQRIHLASAALGLGCSGIGAFYDDEVRAFLELEHSGWETIFELVIGVTASPTPT